MLYELNPKSIFLEYMGARFMGAKSEMRDFGAMVTYAGWMPRWQDHLHCAWEVIVLNHCFSVAWHIWRERRLPV